MNAFAIWEKRRRKIRRLANRLGCPIDENLVVYECAWTGERIAGKHRSNDIVIHDIAHFVIAPPRRRRMPDFGLGSDPEVVVPLHDSSIREEAAIAEEYRASVLGALIASALKMEYPKIPSNWSDDAPRFRRLSRSIKKKEWPIVLRAL